jgi:hypothetical protein
MTLETRAALLKQIQDVEETTSPEPSPTARALCVVARILLELDPRPGRSYDGP